MQCCSPYSNECFYYDENIKTSPEEMYLLSLKIHQKLPEELHDAMILWSFNVDKKHIVQDYLFWVHHTEQRKNYREKIRRLEKTEKIMFIFINLGVSVLALLAIKIIFNK